MNETRQTEIIENELEDSVEITEEVEQNVVQEDVAVEEKIDPRVEKRDQFFEEIKTVLLEQDRLLTKFFAHSDEHCEFDYEEMGLSFEEEEDHLRRTNKLKDKILDQLDATIETKCTNRTIDTLHNMILCEAPFQEENFKVVIEVFEDSFDLEVV